jgi:hypothetical protein
MSFTRLSPGEQLLDAHKEDGRQVAPAPVFYSLLFSTRIVCWRFGRACYGTLHSTPQNEPRHDDRFTARPSGKPGSTKRSLIVPGSADFAAATT